MTHPFSIEPIHTEQRNGHDIYCFTTGSNYSDAFGYEWTEYSRTYTDSTLGTNVSRRRLELNLGFPLEFLKGMTVLELGSGQGRFTEILAEYASTVITVDMSEAVFHNVALGKQNVIAVRADINHFPPLREKVDVVFCRGVLQHTENPRKSMYALFTHVKDGGLVIFDVYKKSSRFTIDFKFFWRPIIQRLMSEKTFHTFLVKHLNVLYTSHHMFERFINSIPVVRSIFGRLPFHYNFNWDKEYSQLPLEKRKDIFCNEFIDMLYSGYDQPMSPEEVINTLAEIGQTPYSYDHYRNHFRCKKNHDMKPIKVKATKNGVVPMTA